MSQLPEPLDQWCPTFLRSGKIFEQKSPAGKKQGRKTSCQAKMCMVYTSHKSLFMNKGFAWHDVLRPCFLSLVPNIGKSLGKKMPGGTRLSTAALDHGF
jgi:hypothetical protein